MASLVDAAWAAADNRVYLGGVPSAVPFYLACGFTIVEVIHDGETTVMERRRSS